MPVTVGVILYQSLSPKISIVPLIGVDRFDHVQYEVVDEPQSSAALAPACVTAIVRVTAGEPLVVVIVTVAERADVDAFTAAVKLTPALPEPEVGDTVNQLAFDDTLHVVFDVTDVVVPSAPDADGPEAFAAQLDNDEDNCGAAPGAVAVTV